MFFKPSFAGDKVFLGIRKGSEFYSDGVWLDSGIRTLEEVCQMLERTIEIK